MKNKTLWIIYISFLIVVVFFTAFFLKGGKLPWTEEKEITPYVPPLGEVLPTATFFSPSAVTPTFEPDMVWIDPDLPDILLDQLAGMDFLQITDQQEDAATSLVSVMKIQLHTGSLLLPFPSRQSGTGSPWKVFNLPGREGKTP